jgi:hypothetical protein
MTYVVEFWEASYMRVYLGFSQAWVARRFIQEVVELSPTKWKTPKTLSTKLKWPNGEPILIVSDDLEEIMEVELTNEQKKWRLLAPFDGYAARIRGGERVATPRIDALEQMNASAPSSKRLTLKRTNADTPPLTPRRKTMGSAATISLADICEQQSWDARKARSILRRKKCPKPYEWEDAADIVKLLKKEM